MQRAFQANESEAEHEKLQHYNKTLRPAKLQLVRKPGSCHSVSQALLADCSVPVSPVLSCMCQTLVSTLSDASGLQVRDIRGTAKASQGQQVDKPASAVSPAAAAAATSRKPTARKVGYMRVLSAPAELHLQL